MTNLRRLPLSLTLLMFLTLSLSAHAETLLLTSGEIVEGTLLSFKDGLFSISSAEGKLRKIPKSQVVRVKMQEMPTESASQKETPKNFLNVLPKKESKYSTPSRTFTIWREAAEAGNIDEMVACYAEFRKEDVRKTLRKLSRKERAKMQKTTIMTEFLPGQPLYKGDRAALEVNWRIGLQGDTQVLQFMLEGDDWKIIQ